MNYDFDRDFVRWVDDPEMLNRLYAYRSPVMREGRAYVIPSATHPGQTEKKTGITTVMKLHIYKAGAHSRDRMRQRTGRGQQRGNTRPAVVHRWLAFNAPLRAGQRPAILLLKGAERGTMVHRQIMEIVFGASMEAVLRLPGNRLGIHPYARMVLTHLINEMGLRPFLSEFRIHDAVIDCATQIDLVAIDKTGRIVFIELKTGYSEGRFLRDCGDSWRIRALADVSATFPCNERNKAVVQIVGGAVMAARKLRIPGTAFSTCVLRVDDYGVYAEIVEPRFMNWLADVLYASLVAERAARHIAR